MFRDVMKKTIYKGVRILNNLNLFMDVYKHRKFLWIQWNLDIQVNKIYFQIQGGSLYKKP
jgi:hypothetical protein